MVLVQRPHFRRGRRRNVASYYSALSGKPLHVQYVHPCCRYAIRNPEFDARAGVTSGDEESVVHAKRARCCSQHDVGFDYSFFDANGNGTVSEKELAILAIDKYTLGGGRAPDAGCLRRVWSQRVRTDRPGRAPLGNGDLRTRARPSAFSAPFDLYGASNSSGDVPCYNWHMALQSCNALGRRGRQHEHVLHGPVAPRSPLRMDHDPSQRDSERRIQRLADAATGRLRNIGTSGVARIAGAELRNPSTFEVPVERRQRLRGRSVFATA
jgi:hypothetical protein